MLRKKNQAGKFIPVVGSADYRKGKEMSNLNFPDGSSIEQSEGGIHSVSGEMAMDVFRFRTLLISLKFEVETGMKMTRISALKTAEAWSGQTFGRGKSAKVKAMAWAEDEMNRILSQAV